MKERIPISVRYIFNVYIAGLLFFTFFRLLLLFNDWESIHTLPDPAGKLLYAFFMGFRFDTVISGYVLIAPLVLMWLVELAGWMRRGFLYGVHLFLSVAYGICFFGCAADIPYYKNYNTRLNASILSWTDSPAFMVKMVIQDWGFLAFLLLFIFILIIWVVLLKRIYKRFSSQLSVLQSQPRHNFPKIALGLLSIGLLFLGIRGRMNEKTPIQIGTAFFCSYNMPNQLGLNPMFTFIRSYLDLSKEENKYLRLIDDKVAIAYARDYFHVADPLLYKDFPIARKVVNKPVSQRCNVVLVMMESMSASFMARYGNAGALTPNLDALATSGYCFDHFYSAGLHTHNGIFSSLYAFPALMSRHTMYDDVIPQYTGLPYVLRQNGYHNMFFLTHDEEFDNIRGFTTVNYFDEVIGQSFFPGSESLSTLGVPDHKLFEHVIKKVDQVSGSGKPFFAAIMTGSNHNPFVIPEGIPFKPAGADERSNGVSYADWSIGMFMKEAAGKPWFRNTIFIFVGDHGAINNSDMYGDLSYSYSHIPLIIYGPGMVGQQVFNTPGGQIDIFPTVCDLLGISYINNTLGVDLIKQPRPYMFFSADDKIGVASTDYIYIWHREGKEQMFELGKSFTIDVLEQQRGKADSMKNFALSMTQTYQWMLANKRTGAAR